MSDIKPIIIYSHDSGPNPWKVVMTFEELGLPYEQIMIDDMAKVKQEPYISLNPNGRVPTITDPNTGIVLWESGAIIEYLIETYDKDKKLTLDSFPEKYHLKQYLHFQMSGQGPYFGQLSWFKNFHPEKIEGVIQRYEDQMFRVISVLDRALEGKEYLVGGKFTYADLAFISWETITRRMYPDMEERTKIYPNYSAWWARISTRPAIQKTLKAKQMAMEASKARKEAAKSA